VQWESGGLLQFPDPKRVTGVSSDGNFAFVEGSSTGLPVGQLTKETAPISVQRIPVNPPQPSSKNNVQEDVYSLPEGRIVVQWPAVLSPESVEEVKDYLKLLERKIIRSAAKDENPE
jgi:hypothetical protein